MARTFKILSALLSYPNADICTAAPEFRAVIEQENLLPANVRKRIIELVDQLATRDLIDLQERYVLLFDQTRSLSLHLFEHVHGEGRDRGQAMVDLAQLYEEHGLEISAKELPDYLPLFLEFLSTLPFEEARDLLAQPLHVITALGERLRKRESVYRGVVMGIEALAKAKPDAEALKELLALPDDDVNDLEALDKAWADEPVTFGPDSSGCNPVAGMLRRMGANLDGPRAPGNNKTN
jgi:nitrate reductase delta subunit